MAVIIMCAILYWIIKKVRIVSERKRIEAMRKEAEAAKWRSAMEKEQERIAREQAKQAAQIAKHEEEIKQLKSKMNNYVEIVRDMRQRVTNLEELRDIAEKEYFSADRAGDDTRREKALKKIVSLDNQIAAAKEKSRKAKADWNAAQRKISA